MDILIKNGVFVTMDKDRRVLKNFSLAVEDGVIKEMGANITGEADFVLDAEGKIVLPGLINAHTHLAMTLLRGIADDLELMKWLREVIWPIEGKLEARHVYAGSLLGCLEMITTGTTCFNDMYFFMEEVARSVREVGLRGVLSYPIIALEGTDVDKLLREADRGVKEHAGRDGLVTAFFGPHAPYTCPREVLQKVRDMAEKRGTGVHIHVSETKEEVENSIKEHGMPPFQYLDSIGFLYDRVVAAHAVWVSGEEIRILRKTGTKVVHNPVCNMKLASGIARVPEYLDSGVTVALGTDGAASNNTLDMFDTMKTCALLHKISAMDPAVMPAYQTLELATIKAAESLGLGDRIGSLEEGKRADIILVDAGRPGLTPLNNPVSHLVYSARGCDVDTVIVDGKIVMENKVTRTLDRNEVLRFAQEQATDLLSRAGKKELVL
jgi:5-methylthioadenosine/S-adenosylhomocysteine deaminase